MVLNIKHVFFYMIFLCIYPLCLIAQSFTVPLKFYGNVPIITIDYQERKLNFLFETGTSYNRLYRSGAEKLLDDISLLYRTYYEAYKDKFIFTDSEAEITEQLDAFFSDLSTQFYARNLQIANHTLSEKNFRLDFKGNENKSEIDGIVIDGIVNLSFFEDFKNLTLDYKGKQLILNSTKKMGKSVPLKKFNKIDSYAVSIKIDGVKQDALIGTGTNDFIIRSDYKSSKTYTDDELASAIELMLTHPYEEGYLVGSKRIEVAGQSANFFARHLSEGEIKSNPKFAALCEKINILGYPVLSSFIFTFDFENKRVFVREYEE